MSGSPESRDGHNSKFHPSSEEQRLKNLSCFERLEKISPIPIGRIRRHSDTFIKDGASEYFTVTNIRSSIEDAVQMMTIDIMRKDKNVGFFRFYKSGSSLKTIFVDVPEVGLELLPVELKIQQDDYVEVDRAIGLIESGEYKFIEHAEFRNKYY